MGYSITIGEVQVGQLQCEEGQYTAPVYVSVQTTPNAPIDNSPTSRTNQRWPAYGSWQDFCDKTGLTSVFFDDNVGLMRNHPGVAELSTEHLRTVQAAASSLRKHQPAIYEQHKDRIVWLEYWMEWALKNCVKPAVSNS